MISDIKIKFSFYGLIHQVIIYFSFKQQCILITFKINELLINF